MRNVMHAKPRMPPKGSRAAIVLEHLYAAPCAAVEISRRHSDMQISAAKLEAVFEGLIAIGCVALDGDVYSISASARRHFDRASMPPPPVGMAAGPAYVPPNRPMKRQPVRLADMREGADDYRAIPSRVGDRRYAHGQGK